MPELTACLSSISAALINNVLLQLHERKEVLQWAEPTELKVFPKSNLGVCAIVEKPHS